MMNNSVLIISTLIICWGCQPVLKPSDTTFSRSADYQHEIDQLISRDAQNKQWARTCLYEIDQAMLHDDMSSYVFFVGQFEQIPLETVPDWLRNEPGYVESISSLELHFRLRWFEKAILLYKQSSNHPINSNH